MKWGLIPAWAKDASIGNKLNNARGETVTQKPSFRSSFAKHRCLIPANGIYEWKAITVDGKVRKQPYFIHPTNPEDVFAFAGLLAAWKLAAVAIHDCLTLGSALLQEETSLASCEQSGLRS